MALPTRYGVVKPYSVNDVYNLRRVGYWGALDDYVKSLLLLRGNLTDETGKTWTNSGGTLGDTTEVGRGIFLNSGRITVPMSTDFNYGADDFTLEFWAAGPIQSSQYLFSSALDGYYAGVNFMIGSDLNIYATVTGSSWINRSKSGIIPGQVNHLAAIRCNGYLYAAVNGALSAGVAISGSIVQGSSTILSIGATASGTNTVSNMRINCFRYSKGIARWAENFVPPVAPL